MKAIRYISTQAFPFQNKKCADRSQRTKTQIPVVAKQTIYRDSILSYFHRMEFAFYQIRCNKSIDKKGYTYPLVFKGKYTHCLYISFVWLYHYIIQNQKCKYNFKKYLQGSKCRSPKKSQPLDTFVKRLRFYKNTFYSTIGTLFVGQSKF